VGLRETTGGPVVRRLVCVIPTKPRVGGRASRNGGQYHSGLSHGIVVLTVVGSCFRWSLVHSGCLHRVEKFVNTRSLSVVG